MEYFEYIEYYHSSIKKINPVEIETLIQIILNAYKEDRTIYIIGNGGSAANASHFAEDLSKGTIENTLKTKRIKALSLTDNTSFITALANDSGYDSIFVQQLITFAKPDDVLIAISGSGNSHNILKAIEWANENNLVTIGISGFNGGNLKNISKNTLHVPLNDMCTVESIHSFLFHFIIIKLQGLINK